MTRRLIVMSSAAVIAVYAAGYFKTESAAEQVAAQSAPLQPTSPSVAISTTPPESPYLAPSPVAIPTPVPTAIDTQVAEAAGAADAGQTSGGPIPTSTSLPPTVAAPPPTATPASRFRDGKYTGTGSSRHGDVQATVVIKAGKIISANIDGCMTRYPCSVIQDLPGEVVQQQSANVDFISGASDSSSAYQEAVASALSQAQAS